jgi:hypothetical protein
VLGKHGNDVGVGKDWAVYRPVRCQPRVPVVPTTPSAQMAQVSQVSQVSQVAQVSEVAQVSPSAPGTPGARPDEARVVPSVVPSVVPRDMPRDMPRDVHRRRPGCAALAPGSHRAPQPAAPRVRQPPCRTAARPAP